METKKQNQNKPLYWLITIIFVAYVTMCVMLTIN